MYFCGYVFRSRDRIRKPEDRIRRIADPSRKPEDRIRRIADPSRKPEDRIRRIVATVFGSRRTYSEFRKFVSRKLNSVKSLIYGVLKIWVYNVNEYKNSRRKRKDVMDKATALRKDRSWDRFLFLAFFLLFLSLLFPYFFFVLYFPSFSSYICWDGGPAPQAIKGVMYMRRGYPRKGGE
jgi:hypothetical protein